MFSQRKVMKQEKTLQAPTRTQMAHLKPTQTHSYIECDFQNTHIKHKICKETVQQYYELFKAQTKPK